MRTHCIGSRLARCERGITAVEFALTMPILLAIGGYGVEIANLSLAHMRVSQYALYLADSASRVGLTAPQASTQLRESDINDIFVGLYEQSKSMKLTTFGRVTLSSLEGKSDGTQWLHWQRCVGLKQNAGGVNYDSSYGTIAKTDTNGKSPSWTNAKNETVSWMGDSNAHITAPVNGGVMFVEINYDYQPLFGSLYVAKQRLHYIASYIVRDTRDYTKVYPSSPAAVSDCFTWGAIPPGGRA